MERRALEDKEVEAVVREEKREKQERRLDEEGGIELTGSLPSTKECRTIQFPTLHTRFEELHRRLAK